MGQQLVLDMQSPNEPVSPMPKDEEAIKSIVNLVPANVNDEIDDNLRQSEEGKDNILNEKQIKYKPLGAV